MLTLFGGFRGWFQRLLFAKWCVMPRCANSSVDAHYRLSSSKDAHNLLAYSASRNSLINNTSTSFERRRRTLPKIIRSLSKEDVKQTNKPPRVVEVGNISPPANPQDVQLPSTKSFDDFKRAFPKEGPSAPCFASFRYQWLYI